jgi:chitinase
VDNDGDGLKDFKIGGGGDPDCPAPEGTSETPTVTFGDDLETSGETGVINVPVELTSPQAGTVTVGYSTSNGTATAGADYTAASGGTVSFQPSEVEESIPITLLSDTRDELDETFTITLSGPTGGVTLGDAAITVTITDDDPPPALSVSGSTVPEGNSGTRTVRFTVTLTPVSGKTVSVSYATANGTASAGSDYVARSGTLTFTPGVTSGFVDVVVNGDTVPEANETFSLLLSGPVNATVGTGSASSTITNDDAAGTSSLSIADGSVTEGNGSSVNLQLTITLTPASSQTVTVSWATSNGTAVAPGDYTAKSTTATFSPGVVSRTISVPVNGDTLNENDETFTVTLSNPTNATIADGTATGTITNDDAAGAATLTVKDGSLLEPDTGTNGSLKVKITLSAASTQTITVQFATVGGTAAEGSDYQKKTGTVTFQPGQTSKTVSVSIVGDTAGENDETFTVTLSNPTNATIADAQATCTIVDDD